MPESKKTAFIFLKNIYTFNNEKNCTFYQQLLRTKKGKYVFVKCLSQVRNALK